MPIVQTKWSVGPHLAPSTQQEENQGFSAKRLEEVFNKYKEEDDDHTIGPTGMEKFCGDLGVDPEDVSTPIRGHQSMPHTSNAPSSLQVVTLVIAYHLKAQQMGSFSKEEFMKGFETLG